MLKSISIEEFNYRLPEDKIAANPLQRRDSGKLLVFNQSKITENFFYNIDELITEQTLLVFNNTSVIKARLYFDTGVKKRVEIFCLEPDTGTHDFQKALTAKSPVRWNCLVGNFKKKSWKTILEQFIETATYKFHLQARVIEKKESVFAVEFSWNNNLSFEAVLDAAGNMPLPPYIKRKTLEEDEQRYQTIYAKSKGSVAAPTAGLHFTENVFRKLKQKNIDIEYVTLHVGAGTFMPVKTKDALQHTMHAEWIEVNKSLIKKIEAGHYSKLVAIGTTSLRTLESLFWMGAKLVCNDNDKNNYDNKRSSLARYEDYNIKDLQLDQWEAYQHSLQKVSVKQSMKALLQKLEKENKENLIANTKLMIVPGYDFKIIDGLVTNFHQPKSTLLLLVAALIGNDWRKIYEYALNQNFRFLSYGDGCLLWKNQELEASSR